MRTNIEIDQVLLRKAMESCGELTKKATVESALLLAVRLKKQEGIRGLFGNVQWDGDLDAMREGRVLDSGAGPGTLGAENRDADSLDAIQGAIKKGRRESACAD